LRSIGVGLEDHGGSVGDDLAHGLADLGRIETHHDDAVGAHRCGVAHHPVDGVPPGFLEKLRVFRDLAADDGAQSGHDISADAA
jgi:hypothetical protein